MANNPFDFDAPDGSDLDFAARPEAHYQALQRGQGKSAMPGWVCLTLLLIMPVVPFVLLGLELQSFDFRLGLAIWAVLYVSLEIITIVWVASDGRGEHGTPTWILVIFFLGALGLLAYMFGRSD